MSTQRQHLLAAASLGVRFRWRQDRWEHDVLLREKDEWIPLVASVEGTEVDHWPASPPLQSLEVDDKHGDTQTVLLIGMAGKCHWSLSVELDQVSQQARFDVACRMRGSGGPLGSRYRAIRAATRIDDQVACVSRLRIATDRQLAARLSVVDRVVSIHPEDANRGADAQTIRWAYTIGLGTPTAAT